MLGHIKIKYIDISIFSMTKMKQQN